MTATDRCAACGEKCRRADLELVRWKERLRLFCRRCAGDYRLRGLISRYPPVRER